MPSNKWLLSGASILLAAAIFGLMFSKPSGVFAAGGCPTGSVCVSDATIADFAQGQFYLTGLRNTFDGKVQLLPFGLTTPWNPDSNALPGNRTELAAAIYTNTIYVIGGFDGTISGGHAYARREIYTARTLITGPIASAWTNPISLPVGLGSMPAVISTTQTGAYLYVLGGQTDKCGLSCQHGSTYTSTIFYHALDATGAFTGSWNTSSMTTTYLFYPASGLIYHQAVVHNGFLYVIGGNDGVGPGQDGLNADHAEILRAPINPNGSLGAWVPDQPLLSPRSSFAVAVFPNGNGTDYLYVMGGKQSSTGMADVDVTTFNGDGTLSGFAPSSFSLHQASYAHGGVQGNGQIYVTGGYLSSSGIVTTVVESTVIKQDGSFPFDWNPTNPLPGPREFHATVINSGGEVYVIGGYDGSVATNTVYHGSTSGEGKTYVSSGNYTSRIIDMGGAHPLTSLDATTTLTNPSGTAMTLTLQYRLGTSQDSLGAWTTLAITSPNGINSKTSYPLGGTTAGYIQYRAFFTTTDETLSPMINRIDVMYPAPLQTPDFTASGLSAPPAFISPMTQTQIITYWVVNNQATSAPVRLIVNMPTKPKSPATQTGGLRKPPPPSSTLQRKAPAAPQSSAPTYMFWVSFYADPSPTPQGPNDIGNTFHELSCTDANSQHPAGFAPFIYYAVELGRTPNPFYASCTVPAGTETFYAQIDTCHIADPDCEWYGYVQEADEQSNSPASFIDNIIHVAAGSSNGGGSGRFLFLPFISKQ